MTDLSIKLGSLERRLMALYRRCGVPSVIFVITACSITLSVLATLALVIPQLTPEDQQGATLLISIGIAIAVPSLVAPLTVWLILSLLIRLDEAYLTVLRLSTTDALTGSSNRRGFFSAASTRLDAWHPSDSGVVGMVDLNRFKSLNDCFGHSVGDAALRMLASRLQGILVNGIVGRLGGDEFAFLITGADDAIEQLIREVQEQCGNFALYHDISPQPIVVSASIGVTRLERDESLDEALLRADAALYAEKRNVSQPHENQGIDLRKQTREPLTG